MIKVQFYTLHRKLLWDHFKCRHSLSWMSTSTALSTMPGTEEIKRAWTHGSNYKIKSSQGNFTCSPWDVQECFTNKKEKDGGYTFHYEYNISSQLPLLFLSPLTILFHVSTALPMLHLFLLLSYTWFSQLLESHTQLRALGTHTTSHHTSLLVSPPLPKLLKLEWPWISSCHPFTLHSFLR